MIYKLKICTEDDFENIEFKDLYFDVSKITGWFIPEKKEGENKECINIFFEGDMITVQQEPHIIKYLTKMFVNNCIEV